MPIAYATLSDENDFSDEELLDAILEEEIAAKEEQEVQLAALAREIEKKFETDAAQRQRKENEWYWAERLQLGSMWRYWNRWSSDTEDPFKDNPAVNDDKPEFNIVKPKMKIGQAQMEMLQFGAGTDKNFSIKAKKPSKVQSQVANQAPAFYPDGQTPVINPETGQPMSVGELAGKQSANDDEAARRMDETVWSQLSCVKYGEKMRLGFSDLLWYGSAIYKGPFNSNKGKKVRYRTQAQGQTLWVTAYTEEPAPDFDRVNPWLFYPDSRVICIDDAEHATLVHVYTATQLRKLCTQEGFRHDKVKKLLSAEGGAKGDYYSAFRARAIQYDNTRFLDNKYVILEWHGTVGIDDLGRLGIEPPYKNPLDMYKAEIWVCQGEVLCANLEMLEADTTLPFAVNTWEPDPASIFGFGAILLRDAQRVVNVTYQMVLDNAGLSAQPMVVLNKEAFKSQDNKHELGPGKVFTFTENGAGMTAEQAIQFITVPNNSEHLMQVLSMAREFGNEESIIPLIAGGLGDPQVGDTGATGLAMVMQASTSVLSSKARQWDDNVTKVVVNWFYEWNMQYSTDEEIKGDYDIDVQTSTAYLNKIIGQRDIERLCIEAAQNPEVAKILRIDEAYRARLAGMNIPYDSIVRSKEEVKVIEQQQAEAAANNPDPTVVKAQADMVNAEARAQAVANDAARLEYDKEQGMVLAQIEHDKNTANYETRNNEAMARALDAAAKKDIALLQLASKDKNAAQSLMVDLQLAEDSVETSNFLAGVEADQKARKLDIEEKNADAKLKEIEYAKKHGKGV